MNNADKHASKIGMIHVIFVQTKQMYACMPFYSTIYIYLNERVSILHQTSIIYKGSKIAKQKHRVKVRYFLFGALK